MENYYFMLFNEITDAIAELDSIRARLVRFQQVAEEVYISSKGSSDTSSVS